MKPVVFHHEAQDEFDEAADRYDAQRPGLGDEFRDEVSDTLDRISATPTAFSYYPGSPCRRRAVARFPYKVVYFETDAAILVFSIHHHSRDPGYWLHRLPGP